MSANPYAAPGPEADDASSRGLEVRRPISGYRDQGLLVSILTALLLLQAALSAANSLSALALEFVALGYDLADHIAQASNIAGHAGQGLYLLTFVPFGAFLVIANKNARLWHPISNAWTPASMVWWFVVPILSLVRPYQAVRAVWRASTPEGDVPAGNELLSLWWGAWVIGLFTPYLQVLVASQDDSLLHNLSLALTEAMQLALCLLALLIVRTLHERQGRCAVGAWNQDRARALEASGLL